MTGLEMSESGWVTLEINGRAVFAFIADDKLTMYERMLRRYKSWYPS
jgi:hypothetical protein